MQSGKAPPALGVKRSSRRSAAAPYSKESSESNNSTGLTGMLKDKSAIESWDEDKPASVSAAARGGSSKQRGMTKMASGAAGFMRSATMKVSGKMKVCEMKVSGRFAAPAPPEMVQCTLERDAKGAFGLGLNDHNRITEVAPGSSAEKAGLQVFDRVLKLNGKELKGPLMHSIGKSDSLALSIERPPKSLHDKITAKERQPDSSPYSHRPPAARRGTPSNSSIKEIVEEEEEEEEEEHGQSAPLAASQLGSCASSGRAWRLWAARHSQEEGDPLGAQPLPPKPPISPPLTIQEEQEMADSTMDGSRMSKCSEAEGQQMAADL